MSRRTPRAGLSAALLLGVTGLALAKPPDLPLDHKDTVQPKTAPPEQEVVLEPPVASPWVGRHRDNLEQLRERIRAGQRAAKASTEPAHGGCLSDTPPGAYPCHPPADFVRAHFGAWLETLPPSTRRRVATSLLAGVHPVFCLIHPEKALDFPCDHPAPGAAGFEHFGEGWRTEGEDSPCKAHTLTGILMEEQEEAEAPTAVTSRKADLEKQLNQFVNWSFTNVPLRQALADIADYQGLNIWVDERVVRQASINLDAPVTFNVEQVTCKAALGVLLGKLTYVVRDDGVLEVTAPACCLCPPAAKKPVPAATLRVKVVIDEDELPADEAEEQDESAVPKAVDKPARRPVSAKTVSLVPSGCCAEVDTSARGPRFLCRFPVAGTAVQIRYDRGGFTFSVTPAAPAGAASEECEGPR